MLILDVALDARSYPILIGSGLLRDRALVERAIPGRQVMIVTNDVVGPLYLSRLLEVLTSRTVATVVLPDGEQHKDLGSFSHILSELLRHRFERGCTVVALGGGVVGDVAGFAAACYQRGVRFVQVPTTLLAQVDSAIGGKTAVNHPLGKNMIGAFHQPHAVLSDLDTLATLPAREFRAGLAEVIKYGLIRDFEFFCWLEQNLDALLAREPESLAYAIRRSCENKAAIVTEDERETGVRALLNLGHTFAHAIEHTLGYGQWLHGEAVGAGLCMAGTLSVREGLLAEALQARVVRLVARAGLPTAPPADADPGALLEAMRIDKKNKDGRIRLVLLDRDARAFLTDAYREAQLRETLGLSGEPVD